jgi:hypothetical protein
MESRLPALGRLALLVNEARSVCVKRRCHPRCTRMLPTRHSSVVICTKPRQCPQRLPARQIGPHMERRRTTRPDADNTRLLAPPRPARGLGDRWINLHGPTHDSEPARLLLHALLRSAPYRTQPLSHLDGGAITVSQVLEAGHNHWAPATLAARVWPHRARSPARNSTRLVYFLCADHATVPRCGSRRGFSPRALESRLLLFPADALVFGWVTAGSVYGDRDAVKPVRAPRDARGGCCVTFCE